MAMSKASGLVIPGTSVLAERAGTADGKKQVDMIYS